MYFVSQDAVNVLDVLHKHQNEENADDDYEIVDMDYGDHEDVNSDSEQDYVNVDQDDSEQDYVNVETDDSEQDYVNVSITENRSMLDNNYEDMKVILWNVLLIFKSKKEPRTFTLPKDFKIHLPHKTATHW